MKLGYPESNDHNNEMQNLEDFAQKLLEDDVFLMEYLEQVEAALIPVPVGMKDEIIKKTANLSVQMSYQWKKRKAWLQFFYYSLKVTAGTVAALCFLLFFMQMNKGGGPGGVVKFEGFQKQFETQFQNISYGLRTGDYPLTEKIFLDKKLKINQIEEN